MAINVPEVHDPRLEALSTYAILDTLPEANFDRLVRLAARQFQCAVACISFLDDTRQWIKAGVGVDVSEIDCEDSMCRLVVLHREGKRTLDASLDHRFSSNPFVTDGLKLRFYASAPLITPDGHAIGALCVADPVARTCWTDDDQATLQDLAALVMQELELRLRSRTAEHAALAETLYAQRLKASLRLTETLKGIDDLVNLHLRPAELLLRAAGLTAAALEVDWGGLSAVESLQATTVTAWQTARAGPFARLAEGGARTPLGFLLWPAVKHAALHFIDDYPAHDGWQRGLRNAGAHAVVSGSLGQYGTQTYVLTLVRLEPQRGWSPAERELLELLTRHLRQALTRRCEQLALAHSQEQQRLILNAGPLVLWATDAQGVFTLSEGRGLTDIGLVPEAAVGQRVEVLYAGSPAVIDNVRRALAGESFTVAVDAAGRVFESSYAPTYGEDGAISGAMGVGYDVTERVRAEQQERRVRLYAEALVGLSLVLEDDAQLERVAKDVLGALTPALPGAFLLLWKLRGEMFVPLALAGDLPPGVHPEDWPGLPAAQLEPHAVLAGRRSFLTEAELSEAARTLGLTGVALLPVLTGEDGQVILLQVCYSGEFQAWEAVERQLLETAARTLTAWATRRQDRRRLEETTKTDVLTGLGNRRAFEADLVTTLAATRRSGGTLGVLTIDLDGLKAINDADGHARGDQVLRSFAVALTASFRVGDRAYRLGGDEYVVILPNIGPEVPGGVVARVEAAVQRMRNQGFVDLGASAGLACCPHDSTDAAELLQLSDMRMYEQKVARRGGGGVQSARL